MAGVRPDGSWTIDRTSIGAEYVQRILGSGQARAIERPLGADFAARLRLDCLGRVETSLVLSVNGTVVGMVTDPSGLGPGNVGMAGLSATGLTFDNLVVEEIASKDTGTSVPAGVGALGLFKGERLIGTRPPERPAHTLIRRLFGRTCPRTRPNSTTRVPPRKRLLQLVCHVSR